MSLPNKVEQLTVDVDLFKQIVHGGPDTVVQTEGGPVKSIANVVASAEAVLAELAQIAPELNSTRGASLVRTTSGETVQGELESVRADFLALQQYLAANLNTDQVTEGDRLYFTEARVIAAKIADLSLVSGAALANGDTIVAALGKLQKQLNNMTTTLGEASNRPGDVVISARAGDYVPPNWLPCDGATYLRSSYPALAEVLPVQYPTTRMSDPVGGMPTDGSSVVAFSPDGMYLAVGGSFSSYLRIWKRTSPTTFSATGVSYPAPLGAVSALAFSPDGTYLAVGHYGTPYFMVLKRSGDVFTKLNSPASASMPTSTVYSLAFGPAGTHLVVGIQQNGGSLAIYKRSGDVFTKIANPSDMPASNVSAAKFSPNGTYLALGGVSGKNLDIYKRSGDIFTRLPDPDVLPASNTRSVAFSPDSKYLAVAFDSAAGAIKLRIYERNGDTFTSIATPPTPGAPYVLDLDFSSNGEYLAAASGNGGFMFRRVGAAFNSVPSPTAGVGYPQAVAFSPDSLTLAYAHSLAPYLSIYRVEYNTNTLFKLPVQTLDGSGLLGYIKT